jgi:hypothetical protein
MKEPVLVVHGVANHDRARFERTVEALQQRVGARFQLIPVFWGDLGGQSTGLSDSLPTMSALSEVTRADDLGAQALFALVQEQRATLPGTDGTRAEEMAVVDALHAATLQAAGVMGATLRGDDTLHRALSEQVPATRYLRHLHDPQLQQTVGELFADYLRAAPADGGGATAGEFVVRGRVDDGLHAWKRFIGKVDELIGRAASTLAGSANQWLRAALAERIASTLGDVVAYHQQRNAIHRRLFEVLDASAAGCGTRERPITVAAHSLGGLVTLDAALGSQMLVDGAPRCLHIKRWITFGSQPAFFHVMAPRHGIAPYTPGQRVDLPYSIGPWTNLWHPLDLLAFSASSVFRMADGSAPMDVRVDSSATEIAKSKGWLHSSYWNSSQLQEAIVAATVS